jgi:hypothetical protein
VDLDAIERWCKTKDDISDHEFTTLTVGEIRALLRTARTLEKVREISTKALSKPTPPYVKAMAEIHATILEGKP